jgi:hypothetical protein
LTPAELRAQLEDDLAWRLDELRHLRNALLNMQEQNQWPVHAMRAILVMQYAHLEGFAQNAFSLYIRAINDRQVPAKDLHPSLFACALVPEFDAIRLGSGNDQESEDGRLLRRAKLQVSFVQKVRDLIEQVMLIDAESAVSLEMNFGSEVLRRTLYRLGMPDGAVNRSHYNSLEFVRVTRNDISHGSRKERIEAGLFEAHRRKCEEFMNDLSRLITRAVDEEWYRVVAN